MSKLSKNIVYNLFGNGLVAIIGFAAVKLIFSKLGAEAMGIIYFTMALNIVLMAILEMGVSVTIVKEVSAYFGSDENYIKKLIGTSSVFYWSIYVLAALLIFLLAPFFVNKWIHLTIMSSATAIEIVRILGIASITVLPKSFYFSLLCGLQKMEFNNIIDVSATALQQLGAFLILIMGGGLMAVIYWFVASYVVWLLIYILVSSYFFSFSSLIPKISFSVIKKNYKFVFSTTLISIFATIHTQIDKIAVSKFLSVGALGYYSFAYSGVSQGGVFTGAVSQAAYPSFSALYKKGDKEGLLAQYHKLQDIICFGTVPIFAAIPFAAMPVFTYVLNARIAHLLFLPITFLCIGFYMSGTINVPYIFSLAANKPGITAKMNFYALFAVLPLAVILIYFFGLPAAGLYFVFYHIFAYIYGIPKICKECIGINVKNWYVHIFRIFALTFLTYGISWFVLEKIGNYSITALILAYSIASIIFLSCSYFLIGKELQINILHYFKILK